MLTRILLAGLCHVFSRLNYCAFDFRTLSDIVFALVSERAVKCLVVLVLPFIALPILIL